MLDAETKRRIDSCRDILVGKVPDPKSQVEQITIALIYKFMDDMDAEAEELGGSRSFFTGDYAKYGWAKLMRSGLGGHETLNLYAEAIAKMPENPGIPALFRDIFKNAYLPYRDPETLRSFLKEIDVFSYDHSEKLGDAFEYLLSVLGSQGDAGQFRTPRHIIDFMVEVMNPQKHESLLDPACGTAGFLISAWKHILKQNTSTKLPSPNGIGGSEAEGEGVRVRAGDQLTPDERTNLAANIHGYDISPDMVRLSLVNLYLHGFSDPHVVEYDTLTSDEKWNETADVILANPPFMSPKGGIKPHKRFSIQASRSEVLFVDYIAEHLSPNGRAAIVVPEGIIFQSQTAYKSLRKLLVEKYLVAVISLPAGVFNPYSGVKTSILILDKRLAKTSDSIAFLKVENDGFGLGAQRRAFDKNDLPQVKGELNAYLQALRSQHPTAELQLTRGLIVTKEKVAANGDYNLSGERYREGIEKITTFPRVRLADVCALITDGDWIESKDQSPEGIRLIQTGNVGIGEYLDKSDKSRFVSEDTFARLHCTEVFQGDILVSRLPDPVGRACILPALSGRAITAVDCSIIRFDPSKFITALFPYYTRTDAYYRQLDAFLTGASRSRISRKNLEDIKIPMPPLEVQKEIVAEIEGYQKVIDGARAVLDHYRPHIPIHPDWLISTFGDAPFQIIDGDQGANYPSKEDFSPAGHCLFLNTKNVRSDGFKFDELEFISEEKDNALRKGKLERGDVLLTTRGTIGNTALYDDSVEFDRIRINSGMLIFRPDITKLLSSYLFHFFQSETFRVQREAIVSGAAQPQLPIRNLNEAKIPIPPLATQQGIVAEIEAEQALVVANRELIARFKKKIQVTLARVWGEVD